MKYIFSVVLLFVALNVSAVTPETFTTNVVDIFKSLDYSNRSFNAVSDLSLKQMFACQASQQIVQFIKYVYANQKYMYLVDNRLMDYLYLQLKVYKPFITNKCKL